MQVLQLWRELTISTVMPGQNTDCSTLLFMLDTPWCAACMAPRISFLSVAGMINLPL